MIEFEVSVTNNFLTLEELSQTWEYIRDVSWVIQKSESGNDSHLEFLYSDLSSESFFTSYIFDKIKEVAGTDMTLDRVYLNGQWHNREGGLHKDGCDVTSLIYLSDYQPHWGGFTQIFLDDGREVVVSPQQGRMILFPGNCLHKGYSFSYQECSLRVSLAYKMNLP